MIYENYLLEQLNICKAQLGFSDLKIKVTKERDFKLKSEGVTFIVKNISGSYVLGIRTQPVQIICYSEINTMVKLQQLIELFVKTHHQTQFHDTWIDDSNVSHTDLIKQDYDTPVALRPMLQTDAGYKASYYFYGSYVVCEDLADVQDFKWYNSASTEADKWEKIEYTALSLGYAPVINTTKRSGVKLSQSDMQEASLTLTLSILNKSNAFCKLVNKIMLGKISGNTKIKIKFTLNEENFEEYMTLDACPLSTSPVAAPGLQVRLVL